MYSLDVLLFLFGTICYSMSSSNCCFLTCIQISQEAGRMVWYSHLFKNFQQFVVIHTIKGFSIVSEAEADVFLEFSCFFYDPADIWSLGPLPFLNPACTSGSSQFMCCCTCYDLIWFVQSLSCVWLFVAPWTAARQASLSFSISWSLLKLMSIESLMPSIHLILCHPLLLLPSIFPTIRVFSS